MARLLRVVVAFARRSPAQACVALATVLLLVAGVVAVATRSTGGDALEVVTGDDLPVPLDVSLPTTSLPLDSSTATSLPSLTTPTLRLPTTTTSTAPPSTARFGAVDRVGASGLYLVNADGTGLRRVADEGGFTVAWSPDGSRIAYMAERALLVVRVADGRTVRLPRPGTVVPAAWSPDGTRVAWSDGSDVVVASADGTGTPRTIATPWNEASVSWSSADRLAVAGSDGIVTFAPDGSNPLHVSREPLNEGVIAWSPDATRLVVAVEGQGFALALQADGSDSKRVGGSAEGDPGIWAADWAPDSRRLLWWEGGRRTGSTALYVGGSDGTLGEQIATGFDYPDWSATGETIVGARLTSTGRYQEIATLRSDGSGAKVVLATEGGRVVHPRWSPDGSTIAFIGHPYPYPGSPFD